MKILANIYREARTIVTLHEAMPEFPTCKVFRQSDAISPKLFIVTLENIIPQNRLVQQSSVYERLAHPSEV